MKHKLRSAAQVFALLFTTVFQAQAPAPAPNGRALPLKRFEVSRRTQADAQGFFRMATAVEDDYFDGRDTRARVQRHMRVARQVGAKYLRCAFSWNGIEPEDEKYNFAFWDMLVEEAEKAGIGLIPYVAYTPEWAARTETNFWQQPPRDPGLFARVMKTLAARYRGRVRSWELWNEPDLKEYWQGTAAEFATLVKAGAVAVREGDPDAVIVLGGMSHGPAEFFDALMREHQIYRWVDVIAMHGYPESWDEDRVEKVYVKRVEKMEDYIRHGGSGLDLWLNELGYADFRYQPAKASVWGTNTYYNYEHTPRYAAEFLFKTMALTAASGDVSLAGWYRIDDFRHSDNRMPSDKVHYHLGLVDVNGRPKPTFYAMKFADRIFQRPLRNRLGRESEEAEQGAKAVVRVFDGREGKVFVTAWIRSSEYNEVARHTGMEIDRRRERVDIALPCVADRVSTYNALGSRLSSVKRRVRSLKNVLLRSSRVYVAEVVCASGQ